MTAIIGIEGSNARADESKWALRRAFEHIARDRPLVVVLDDLQWGEPPVLDLVDYLAETVTDAQVLLLCMARPELLDDRPSWGGGKLNTTTILLEPLDAAHADELVAQLLGGRTVPDELRIRSPRPPRETRCSPKSCLGICTSAGTSRSPRKR